MQDRRVFLPLLHLDLTGCPIDGDDLAALPVLPRLRSLESLETRVTGRGLPHLYPFPSLRSLMMFDVPLTERH